MPANTTGNIAALHNMLNGVLSRKKPWVEHAYLLIEYAIMYLFSSITDNSVKFVWSLVLFLLMQSGLCFYQFPSPSHTQIRTHVHMYVFLCRQNLWLPYMCWIYVYVRFLWLHLMGNLLCASRVATCRVYMWRLLDMLVVHYSSCRTNVQHVFSDTQQFLSQYNH
jgi:hypothetical protein